MTGHYDPVLIPVSILVAMLASYTALDLASSVYIARGRTRMAWLIVGSLAMGAGIWSMHFVGMLAFHLPGVRIAYEFKLVVISILVAIVASAVALVTLKYDRISTIRLVFAGLAMGVAIAGMHYTGMAALRAPVVIEWDASIVAASIAIAIAASFVALNLAARVRDTSRQKARWLKIGGAVVMGFAISGMHYTGMAAANFISHPEFAFDADEYLVATTTLGLSVAGTTVLLLLVAIAGSSITREVARRADFTRQLRQSQEYFQALSENASDIIVVTDERGRRTYVSPSFSRIIGRPTEELLGSTTFELIHPEDLPKAQAAFAQLLEEPERNVTFSARMQQPDGDVRMLRIIGQNLLANPAVHGIILTATDETERHRLELQFQQAQKMEAIGKLAGGVAHDFNNLLTVILGNLQILQTETPTEAELRSGLLEIQRAAERAAGLTRQLLAFSRRQMLQPRVVDLNDIVVNIQTMLMRLLSEDITVCAQLDDALWRVSADPGQVEQAIMNLAVNARDAMPAGGMLTIRTRNITDPDMLLTTDDGIAPGDYAVIEVTDLGSGIEPGVIDHVFEPFFTTKEVGKGTGLGLATVYGIMKQSGGYVTVESEAGSGTTFTLLFPRSSDADTSEAVGHDGTPARLGTGTIIIVEDEPAVRALARRALERNGFRVLENADAAHALPCARDHSGTIDLLLSDVVLPDMNGREVADRISAMRPGIRVLLMSGYTEDAMLHRGVLTDDVNFLQKPFTADTLVQAVRAALA